MSDALTARVRERTTTITLASILFYVTGVPFLIGTPIILLYVLTQGTLPVIFGTKALGGGPFESLGPDAIVGLAFMFLVVSALEILAARWLWQSRKRGGLLGLILLPVGLMFWIGFALPGSLVLGPVRTVLVAAGWKTLR